MKVFSLGLLGLLSFLASSINAESADASTTPLPQREDIFSSGLVSLVTSSGSVMYCGGFLCLPTSMFGSQTSPVQAPGTDRLPPIFPTPVVTVATESNGILTTEIVPVASASAVPQQGTDRLPPIFPTGIVTITTTSNGVVATETVPAITTTSTDSNGRLTTGLVPASLTTITTYSNGIPATKTVPVANNPTGVVTITTESNGILSTEIVPAGGSGPITTFGTQQPGNPTPVPAGPSPTFPASWTFTYTNGATVITPFPAQTSTITSLPNVWTSHTTNSAWISNTYTTVSGTPLPVVDVDPSTHSGIIVGGIPFPPPPNIVLSLPGLPKISWPCVPIPFILSCPGPNGPGTPPAPPGPPAPPPPGPPPDYPPTTYGGGNNPGSEPDGNPNDSPTASVTSSDGSPSSSFSFSWCTSATTIGRRQASPTEAPACPIPDSTWEEYMIVPIYGPNNYGAQQAFTSTLKQTLGANYTYILEVASQNTVYYWTATMNSTQLKLFSSDPVVNYTMPTSVLNKITTNDFPEGNNTVQKRSWDWSNSNEQLYYLSQAPGVTFPQGYFFDSTQGAGSTIYIIDTGCDPNHSQFVRQDLHNPANWIFPKGLGTVVNAAGVEVPWITTEMNDPIGHGTKMGAAAAGLGLGVAPLAQLVCVKALSTPEGVPSGVKIYEWILAAVGDILLDIQARGSGTHAVLQQAQVLFIVPGYEFLFSPGSPYYRLYADIFAAGATVVTSAGNEATDGYPELNTYPALLGTTTNWPIIIVGGSNADGTIWPQTQGLQSGRIDVFALASDVVSVEANSDPNAQTVIDGTSGASAAVSGLMAYLLGLEVAAAARSAYPGAFSAWARKFVTSLAYPRIPGGVPIIYNGAPADVLDQLCALNTGTGSPVESGIAKREAPSCSSCVCSATPGPSTSVQPTAIPSSNGVVTVVPTNLPSHSVVTIAPIVTVAPTLPATSSSKITSSSTSSSIRTSSSTMPIVPTSSGFFIAGLEATLSTDSTPLGHSTYIEIIMGPNQHSGCIDIATAFTLTSNHSTPHYVVDAYIIGNANGPDGANAYQLAETKNAILVESQPCSKGQNCFQLCNTDQEPSIELAANNGDWNTPVSFSEVGSKNSLGKCTFVNKKQSCTLLTPEINKIDKYTVQYLWDCVGNNPKFCAGDY